MVLFVELVRKSLCWGCLFYFFYLDINKILDKKVTSKFYSENYNFHCFYPVTLHNLLPSTGMSVEQNSIDSAQKHVLQQLLFLLLWTFVTPSPHSHLTHTLTHPPHTCSPPPAVLASRMALRENKPTNSL